MLPPFDEDRLKQQLQALTPVQRVRFGLACVQRMLPNYARFAAEIGRAPGNELDAAIHVLQEYSAGAEPNPQTVRAIVADLEQLAPDSDDYDTLHTGPAQDVIFAICGLLDIFAGEDSIDKTALAARYATDSIDLLVQEEQDMSPEDPERERRITESARMQEELRQQQSNIEELLAEN